MAGCRIISTLILSAEVKHFTTQAAKARLTIARPVAIAILSVLGRLSALILSITTKEKRHNSLMVAPSSFSSKVAGLTTTSFGGAVQSLLEDVNRAIGLTFLLSFECNCHMASS